MLHLHGGTFSGKFPTVPLQCPYRAHTPRHSYTTRRRSIAALDPSDPLGRPIFLSTFVSGRTCSRIHSRIPSRIPSRIHSRIHSLIHSRICGRICSRIVVIAVSYSYSGITALIYILVLVSHVSCPMSHVSCLMICDVCPLFFTP